MNEIGWTVIGVMGAWLLLCHINILILTRWRDRDKAVAAKAYHDLADRLTRMESK